MNGWGIAANLTNLVSRLPIERLLTRDHTKDLDEFEERLKEKGLLISTTKSPQHNSEQGLRANGLLSPTGARVTQNPSPAESPARNASEAVSAPMEPTTEETVMELRRRLGKEPVASSSWVVPSIIHFMVASSGSTPDKRERAANPDPIRVLPVLLSVQTPD